MSRYQESLDRLHMSEEAEQRIKDLYNKADLGKERKGMRIGKLMRPAAAIAACLAIVLVIHLWFDNGNMDQVVSEITNSFTVEVMAKELTKDTPVPVKTDKAANSSALGGDPQKRIICYSIAMPVKCKGENIKSITYRINKGAFQIVGKEKGLSHLTGTECAADSYNVPLCIGSRSNNSVKERLYTEFTTSYENQPGGKDTDLNICGEIKGVDKKTYRKFWKTDATLQELLESRREVFDGIVITCEVHFQDGTSQSREIELGCQLLAYRDVFPKEMLKPNTDGKNDKHVFFTYKLRG